MGLRNELVPNTFFPVKRARRGIWQLLLPGLGYTSAKCLSCIILAWRFLQRGRMCYAPTTTNVRCAGLYGAWSGWAQTTGSRRCNGRLLRRLSCKRKYDKVTLVGKSIGTYAMGHLITTSHAFAELAMHLAHASFKTRAFISQIKQVTHRHSLLPVQQIRIFDKTNMDDPYKGNQRESASSLMRRS